MSNERKRSIDSPEGESKRSKPLHNLSESGPLTQSDVVYFQKEAIWRQMLAYKQKSVLLSTELNQFKRKYSENEAKINVLDSWYEQIINLFGRDGDGIDLDEKLLIRIPLNKDEVSSVLDKRRAHLLRILTPLIENLKSSASPDTKELITKLELLNSELMSIKSTNETLEKAKDDLEVRVGTLQNDIFKLVKDKERVNSKTLKRVDDSIKKEPEEEKAETPITPQIENGPVEDNSEYVEKIEVELEELRVTNKLLSVQIEEINEKYGKSENNVLHLANKLSDLKEHDLENNVYYNKLLKNNRSLQDQIVKLTKVNEANIIKLKSFEETQNNVQALLQKGVLEENATVKEQLHKSESDLIRIRTLRDEFIAKNTILKSQLENQKTNDELCKLNGLLNARIELLVSTRDQSTTELSKDEVITLLSGEIKEIEQAFKETREITLKKLASSADQENLIKKLTIEKTKADQKYFASMRLKDSIQNENKLLKVQINKSQELIKNLNDLEKNYLSKIDILTKSINDYKAIKENSVLEVAQLQDSIKALQNKTDLVDSELKKSIQLVEAKTNETLKLGVETNSQRLQITKLERNLKSTESLLKKYKTNNTSSILQEDEQQLDALRSIAKCSVCQKNWKDTAITVCGHVFCSDCTQERLAARLRRCPSCNKGFSANDLLSVHL